MVLAFILRPILQLICCLAFAAPELRLTISAHQAGFVLSLGVLQHVLLEVVAAEFLEALLALMLLVLARRVPSLCADGTYEISIAKSMVSYQYRVPAARIKDIPAGRTSVTVGEQFLPPIALHTTLACESFRLMCLCSMCLCCLQSGICAGLAQAVQAFRPTPLRDILLIEVAGKPDAEVAGVEHVLRLPFQVATGAQVLLRHGVHLLRFRGFIIQRAACCSYHRFCTGWSNDG